MSHSMGAYEAKLMKSDGHGFWLLCFVITSCVTSGKLITFLNTLFSQL